MYKYFFVIILLITSLSVEAQELKFSSSLIGFGIAKIERENKLIVTRFFDVGYEKMIDYFWRWRAGVGYSDVQFDGVNKIGQEYYRQKKFIGIPLALRKYSTLSKKSEVYVELGAYNKYEIIDKIDFSDFSQKDLKYKNGGYSLDMLAFGGFKTQLGKISTIDIGIGGTKNLLTRYKIGQNKIRVSASYITLNLSKKLSR
jgi:hypothetical protein